MKSNEISKNSIYSKQNEVSKTLKNCLTNTKNQKGITLIALVVTIIVLLILAGVTINMALENNGIFEKAKDAQNKMNEAVQNDMEGINYLNEVLSNYANGTGSTGESTGGTPEVPALPTTSETTPYLPDDNFEQVSGTTLDTGLVIEDKSGNQYVWVEVPKTTGVYSTAGLNITDFTSEEYVKIENDLHTYTNYYRNGTSYTDTYYSDAQTGLTSTQYTELKQKMLKSVYKNGGFWVARYEAGIETNRTESGDATVAPISKANVYPYNYVTCRQAQTLANMLTTADYTSSLMFGVQWDLVLKFIEVKSVANGTELSTIQNELTSDSTNWGNYKNNLWSIDSTSAKYSTDSGATCTSAPYTKTSSASVLLTTGASESFSKMNIYDLAGNEWEWTLECTAKTSGPCAIRGGFYDSNGSGNPPSNRIYSPASFSVDYFGFRLALYK